MPQKRGFDFSVCNIDGGILQPQSLITFVSVSASAERALLTTVLTFVACLGMGVEVGLLLGVALDLAYLIYLWARPSVTVQLCKVR